MLNYNFLIYIFLKYLVLFVKYVVVVLFNNLKKVDEIIFNDFKIIQNYFSFLLKNIFLIKSTNPPTIKVNTPPSKGIGCGGGGGGCARSIPSGTTIKNISENIKINAFFIKPKLIYCYSYDDFYLLLIFFANFVPKLLLSLLLFDLLYKL